MIYLRNMLTPCLLAARVVGANDALISSCSILAAFQKSEADNNIFLQATATMYTRLRYNADGYCLDISTAVLVHQINHSTIPRLSTPMKGYLLCRDTLGWIHT